MNDKLLVILPLAIAALLLALALTANSYRSSSSSSSNSITKTVSSLEDVVNVDVMDQSCECPSYISEANCSVMGDAVLGGVDFVQYFTDFKNDDGTYDETQTGLMGDPNISSEYNGYKFYFISDEHKDLFDENPQQYVPQYGGFCSWGMCGEYCPQYPWNKDCLGPSGNWGHWTIQKNSEGEEHLYFFLFDEAKGKFMADPDTYIKQGDARWGSWYVPSDSYYSTHCYVSVVSDRKKR